MSELLSIKETAFRLNVSQDTVRRMIRDGKIKTVEVGKRPKIKEEEIIRITTGRDTKVMTLVSKLTQAGYSANQTAQIIDIVSVSGVI